MAYQIQYGQTVKRFEFPENKQKKPRYLRNLTVFVLALACIYGLKTGFDCDVFVPGNKEITKAAFMELTEDLKDGQPFVQAFSVFCREVVQKDDFT